MSSLVQGIASAGDGQLHNILHNNYAQERPFLPTVQVEKPLKQKTFSYLLHNQ